MKYVEKDVVRSHDTARDDTVRPSILWRYMQEAANHSMREERPSYAELLEKGLAFLLSRMTMRSCFPLYPYQPITVETWACPSKGLSFDRCYRVLDAEGRVAAEGIGTWALLDKASGKLVRVGEVDLHYSTDEPIEALSQITRFRIPREIALETVGERTVYYSDVDVIGHMNNTNYPDMLCDFLPNPGEGRVSRVSISFQREAPLTSTIVIRRGEEKTEDERLRRFYFETEVGGQIGVQAMIEVMV